MRIVQGPDTPASSAAPAPGPAAPDIGRLEALEKIMKSILQRLLSLEEKMEAQESLQQRIPHSTSPSPTVTLGDDSNIQSSIGIDTEAVRKGLLSKMWKYLNDERPSKAA